MCRPREVPRERAKWAVQEDEPNESFGARLAPPARSLALSRLRNVRPSAVAIAVYNDSFGWGFL